VELKMLSERIENAKDFKEKVQLICNHYEDRRLKNELEPEWIHSGYEIAFRFTKEESLEKNEMYLLNQIVKSHSLPDGSSVHAFPDRPNSPMRIIHDGWKAGTPTWIFMGRNSENCVDLGSNWVAVSRTLPETLYAQLDKNIAPPTLWMAYNKKNKMSISDKDENIIGPAIYFEQILFHLKAQNK
jgi:hypothetical protein